MKCLKLLFLAICCMAFLGCARDMALTKGQTTITTADHSIVLLPVKVANKIREGFQPTLVHAFLEGTEKQKISVEDGLFKEEKDAYKDYLLSFSLKPGNYTLKEISGNYLLPFVANANCAVPLQASFEVKPNSVVYMGHLYANIVERENNDEPRAGSLFPLMDQALTGFSIGKFAVSVADRYDQDVANYRSEFPGLQGVTIEKAILSLPMAGN